MSESDGLDLGLSHSLNCLPRGRPTFAINRTVTAFGIHYMGITWALHGRYMGITWALHGHYMGITWALHGHCMGIDIQDGPMFTPIIIVSDPPMSEKN